MVSDDAKYIQYICIHGMFDFTAFFCIDVSLKRFSQSGFQLRGQIGNAESAELVQKPVPTYVHQCL